MQYRSVKDLLTVIDRLYRSRIDPENRKVPVVLYMDEALLYIDSQKFRDLPPEFDAIIVQLRKLGVRIKVVTPRYSFVTSKFRKICEVVTMYGDMRNPPNPGSWFVPKRVFVPFDESCTEDDPRNITISENTVLHVPKRVKFDAFMRRIFPDSPNYQKLRYDTHEVIRTDLDVLDHARLAKLFPISFDVFDSEKYTRFVWDRVNTMYSEAFATEAEGVKKRYRSILAGFPVLAPDGAFSDAPEPQAGESERSLPAVPCPAKTLFDPLADLAPSQS